MLTIFRGIQPRLQILSTANNLFHQKKSFSTNSTIGKVDFNFIKKILGDADKLLIDVRSESEIKETGKIPGSINIPLEDVCKNLSQTTSETDFSSRFGRLKPSTSTQLIFTCRSGKRALQSAETALSIGYKNVWVYEGSWNDWHKRMKESEDSKWKTRVFNL